MSAHEAQLNLEIIVTNHRANPLKAIRASEARLLLFEVVRRKPSLKGPAYRMRRWIELNRAPVLTLWAAVVATRLGFKWEEALTLAR